MLQRDRNVEESVVRRRAHKSVGIDDDSSGDEVCDRGEAPAKLDVASEELDKEVAGDDHGEEHYSTCWIT